jgi:hypothetical protein
LTSGVVSTVVHQCYVEVAPDELAVVVKPDSGG